MTTKAFRRNAQPLEASNVPGGLGDAPPTRKMGSPGKAPDCPFLHFVYTSALLAKSNSPMNNELPGCSLTTIQYDLMIFCLAVLWT